jgi:Xaa-Pro dipeptidase
MTTNSARDAVRTVLPSETPELPAKFCHVDRLIETLRRHELDGLVVYYRPNVYYLSSYGSRANVTFHESNGLAACVISTSAPDSPVLVVPDIDLAYVVRRGSWIEDVRTYSMPSLLPRDIPLTRPSFDIFVPQSVQQTEFGQRARARNGSGLAQVVSEAVRDLNLTGARVGIDEPRFATALDAPGTDFQDAYQLLKFVRQVKTPAELTVMRHATSINEKALQGTVDAWRLGMTWRELNREYYRQVYDLGGWIKDPGGVIFANPHGTDTAWHVETGFDDFVIQPGTNLMFDCHGTFEQYCYDGGKTWFVGTPSSGEIRRVADATTEAMLTIVDAMAPGVRVSELQARGREVYRKHGVSHSDDILIFFHGLGLEHLDMALSHGSWDYQLEENMLLSVHLVYPGGDSDRYFLEDLAQVTATGGQRIYSWSPDPFITE